MSALCVLGAHGTSPESGKHPAPGSPTAAAFVESQNVSVAAAKAADAGTSCARLSQSRHPPLRLLHRDRETESQRDRDKRQTETATKTERAAAPAALRSRCRRRRVLAPLQFASSSVAAVFCSRDLSAARVDLMRALNPRNKHCSFVAAACCLNSRCCCASRFLRHNSRLFWRRRSSFCLIVARRLRARSFAAFVYGSATCFGERFVTQPRDSAGANFECGVRADCTCAAACGGPMAGSVSCSISCSSTCISFSS